MRHRLAQGLDSNGLDPGDLSGLDRIGLGDARGREARPGRGEHGGQHTTYRAHRAVESQFGDERGLLRPGRTDPALGAQHRDGDGQVEARTLLPDGRGRERHRERARRPGDGAVEDGRPDPVAGFAQPGVGQADQAEPGQAGGQHGLGLDGDTGQAEEGDGGRAAIAGHHATAGLEGNDAEREGGAEWKGGAGSRHVGDRVGAGDVGMREGDGTG